MTDKFCELGKESKYYEKRDVRFINLYSDRGEIIGKFRIETNCIALDDKEE